VPGLDERQNSERKERVSGTDPNLSRKSAWPSNGSKINNNKYLRAIGVSFDIMEDTIVPAEIQGGIIGDKRTKAPKRGLCDKSALLELHCLRLA
jgi:hypothetical protein